MTVLKNTHRALSFLNIGVSILSLIRRSNGRIASDNSNQSPPSRLKENGGVLVEEKCTDLGGGCVRIA